MSKFAVKKEKTKLELAYMAGIFDGEGTIYIAKIKPRDGKGPFRYVLSCALVMANPYIPKLFHFSFGGSFIPTKEHLKNPNWQPRWMWSINTRNARSFLEVIKPYLRLKKAEAELAIEFQNNKRYGANPSCWGFRAKTEKELAVEEAQRIALSALKIKSNEGGTIV